MHTSVECISEVGRALLEAACGSEGSFAASPAVQAVARGWGVTVQPFKPYCELGMKALS